MAGRNFLAGIHNETWPVPLLFLLFFDDVIVFDTLISIDAFNSTSDEGQVKLASKGLLEAIQLGQVKASGCTSKQLQQINTEAKKIDGYTWHHHPDSGRMQRVPELIHKTTGHTGGEAMRCEPK